MAVRYRSKRHTNLKRGRKAKRRVAKKTNIAAVVRKVISAEAEDKMVFKTVTANPATGPFPTYISPLPAMLEGVESFNRLGQKVRVKSCYTDIVISIPNTKDATSMISAVRLMAFTSKQFKSYNDLNPATTQGPLNQASITNELLWSSDEGATPPSGFPLSPFLPEQQFYPMNKRVVNVVKDKLCRLVKPQGILSSNQTGISYIGNVASLDNGNLVHKIRINWKTPAQLIYNNQGSYPVNFAPLMALCQYDLTGGIIVNGVADCSLFFKYYYQTKLIYEEL